MAKEREPNLPPWAESARTTFWILFFVGTTGSFVHTVFEVESLSEGIWKWTGATAAVVWIMAGAVWTWAAYHYADMDGPDSV